MDFDSVMFSGEADNLSDNELPKRFPDTCVIMA